MRKIWMILGVASLCAGCASSTQVVSFGAEQVAIAVDDTDDLSDALELANERCGRFNRNPELSRTESVDDGLIVYYECK